ncbi:type VII secretion protein EccB [Streptomyces sp. VRA16 Mangrove soil]|uniref:type VII secretion protein EccB n=1 Tax=Streptomyces sp. VRA16 Mangrove soil TaxID=2817434 RepID=UPI001A9E74B4|nr:type VII secretion protein EccB [Streptomyces sp. VRA16 Mangrove soil]MBO1336033.1 type VII secretion protein EccB [Streptomyces sp. VRA16 Mangrove soil]
MASRRDELNAYTFAKRRTLASFLQPSPSGSEEGAPKPLRAVLPGTILGVVILAVFGAIGMFSPAAAPGWKEPYQNVIVASKSTTRYVIMETGKKKQAQLHPVLNMASAKLLLADNRQDSVMTVEESVLDSGKIPHGVTVGIPYAPDRLPSAEEAGAEKRWMVCQRPTSGGEVQQATFVLGKNDRAKADNTNRLGGGELMYVVSDDKQKTEYIVDASGSKYELSAKSPAEKQQLLRALNAYGKTPEKVSDAWLATLHGGSSPIAFPAFTDTPGAASRNNGSLSAADNKVGKVLVTESATREVQYYVVLADRIASVTPFTAQLLLASPTLSAVNSTSEAQKVALGQIVTDGTPFAGDKKWPEHQAKTVNNASPTVTDGRNVICNTLRGVGDGNATTLSTWAGNDFPVALATGSSSTYVTPGSGQLFRQVQGTDTSGGVFLVTDTGLRYALQSNSDGDAKGTGVDASQKDIQKDLLQQSRIAQTRLGYAKTKATDIPIEWSKLLPTGPVLSTGAARQPQGS